MSMTPEQVQQLLQQVVQSVALQFSEYHKQQQAQQIQFQQQHQEQQHQFQQTANASKPVSSHGNRRLFDEKYFRRVNTYKGSEEGWKSWCFQFKVAVRAASPEAVKTMEWYESHVPDEEFMEEEVMEQDKIDKLDAELYETLCSMLEGEPLTIAQGTEGGSGLHTWRKLYLRYNPKTPARALMAMMQVMAPTKIKDIRLVSKAIEEWEVKLLNLEKEYEEKPSKKMRIALMMSMIPNEIQDVVFQHVEALKEDFKAVKDNICLSLVGDKITMNTYRRSWS